MATRAKSRAVRHIVSSNWTSEAGDSGVACSPMKQHGFFQAGRALSRIDISAECSNLAPPPGPFNPAFVRVAGRRARVLVYGYVSFILSQSQIHSLAPLNPIGL
eukprot:2201245-Pleurochrysis_carterae.AAC.1